MTTTSPHTVDSTTRPCCQGIGNHAPDCTPPKPFVPAGAECHMEGPAAGPMAIEDARKFGAALIAAADELAGQDPEAR